MRDNSSMLEALQGRGFRLTAARARVINVICEDNGYLGAYDIYNTLKAKNIKVGLASIYRILDLLCELGLLQREEFGSSGEKFRTIQEQHTHQLICSRCGEAKEFSNCGIAKLTSNLENSSGFKINEHWLKFFGLCPGCQIKK